MTPTVQVDLVVDDDVDSCLKLFDIFADLGYRVATVIDGPSALELLRRDDYDLALVGWRVDGSNGLGLCRAARASRAGTEVLVLAEAPTDVTQERACRDQRAGEQGARFAARGSQPWHTSGAKEKAAMIMLGSPGDSLEGVDASDFGDEEVVEVGLLLSARQLAAFEAAARCWGLTAGQMLRRLLGGFLGQAELRGADEPPTSA
jgi:CheY-like chemotaxis protein